jgi:hypothetical protein
MGVGDRLSLTGELAGVTRRFAMTAEAATDHAERLAVAVNAWVVVADGSRARVFEAPGLKLDLREIEDLVNVVPSGPALSENDRENLRRQLPCDRRPSWSLRSLLPACAFLAAAYRCRSTKQSLGVSHKATRVARLVPEGSLRRKQECRDSLHEFVHRPEPPRAVVRRQARDCHSIGLPMPLVFCRY